MASAESGLYLNKEESCSVCGHLVYTGLQQSEKLIDANQWDGSDFFIVWPFPNFIFVVEPVVRLIEGLHLSGAFLKRGSTFEFETSDEFSPGRLSHVMPEPRASDIGKPLGIY